MDKSAFVGALGSWQELWNSGEAQDQGELLWEGRPMLWWQVHWKWSWILTKSSPISQWTQLQPCLATLLQPAQHAKRWGRTHACLCPIKRPADLGLDWRSCSSPMTQFQPCSTAFQELVLPTHICAPGSRPADVSPGCELWSCPVTSSNPALPRFSSCSLSNQEEPCVYSQSQACWLQSDHGPWGGLVTWLESHIMWFPENKREREKGRKFT